MGLEAAERLGALREWSSTVVSNIITVTHPVCVFSSGGCITYQFLGVIASAKEANNAAVCVGVYACATLIAGPYFVPSPGTISVEEISALKKGAGGESMIATLSGPELTGGELELFVKKL